jgi:hypothetical protein
MQPAEGELMKTSVTNLIVQEIKWCEEHRDITTSADFQNGFTKGLEQARTLAEYAEIGGRMLTYKYVDDSWSALLRTRGYCVGYWIYDGERRFADAQSEAAAKEICDAVNAARAMACAPIDPKYVSDLHESDLPSCGHASCLGLTRCSFKHD